MVPSCVWSKAYSEDEDYFIKKGRVFFLMVFRWQAPVDWNLRADSIRTGLNTDLLIASEGNRSSTARNAPRAHKIARFLLHLRRVIQDQTSALVSISPKICHVETNGIGDSESNDRRGSLSFTDDKRLSTDIAMEVILHRAQTSGERRGDDNQLHATCVFFFSIFIIYSSSNALEEEHACAGPWRTHEAFQY